MIEKVLIHTVLGDKFTCSYLVYPFSALLYLEIITMCYLLDPVVWNCRNQALPGEGINCPVSDQNQGTNGGQPYMGVAFESVTQIQWFVKVFAH